MEKGMCLKGSVEKIKVLKLEEAPLIRFTLTVNEAYKENCLIKSNALNFLYLVTEGKTIVLFGKRNKRNQFVVQKYYIM
ncbi:MAG: hypothetical protein WA887_05985 [Carnobacterium jeotgali]|uniref:hypothetical protein n=1 Tax=Carnobacterium jeotgali TaxID=545534 RepID=UPI00049367E6